MLLAWFACGNRSLFAAQCLVEVLVELYREGRSFQELQVGAAASAPAAEGEKLGSIRGECCNGHIYAPAAANH